MPIFTTYFSNIQVFLLTGALAAFFSSIVFHVFGKYNASLLFLLLTAFAVFCFAALLDPFLNLWDERFHALVGKNMMHHPFMPTLYDNPVVNMAYDRWDRYHIWLHKQPLFLWQIALSFRLFGTGEFTLRIPSILLGVVFVYTGYRSGNLLVNKRTGLLTGFFMISTVYFIELIGGGQGLDHNDFSFLVYISLSIWAFIEYFYSGRKFWIFLIGIFSGMAILCKWLVGLLIYFGWSVLKAQQRKNQLSEYSDILVAFIMTLFIAVPWQVFTFVRFPAEALLTYKLNTAHFFRVLDGHSGPFWYHFEIFNTIYGVLSSFLILPGFYFMFRNSRNKQLYYSMVSMVGVVYLFFSFTATRMSAFTTVAALPVFVAFGSLFDAAFRYFQKKNPGNIPITLFLFVVFALFILVRFDVESLQAKHTTWKEGNRWTPALTHNKEVFKSLKLPENTVLFNVKGRHYIEAMFYTGIPSYNFIPTKEQYDDLKAKKRNITLFKTVNGELPDYLKNDPSVMVINQEILGDE